MEEIKMVESFGGPLNLIVWLIALAGTGYYAYRCLFATEGMIEQYGFGDQSAFVIHLVGTFVGAGFIMGVVLLLAGPQGAWAFITYCLVQSVLGAIFGYKVLNGPWAEVEGVKPTSEGWIAPLVFAILYAFLLFNMKDILYEIAPVAA
jgi:hypothetical protein